MVALYACKGVGVLSLYLSLLPSFSPSLSLTCEDGVCGRAFFMLARVRTQTSIEICGERKSEGEREKDRERESYFNF